MSSADPRRAGRPPRVPLEVVIRLYELFFEELMSYERIAALLNAEGVALPGRGKRWLRSSVERVMNANYGRAIGIERGYRNKDGTLKPRGKGTRGPMDP